MTSKRDFYETLGVSREATADELRKAYRQAALKHHPDRNPDNPAAVESFKEVTEAYQVLSDDDKRARYDRFGHAGVEGMPDMGGADVFSHFQDLFSEMFGGFGGFGGGQRGPARGQDVRVAQKLSFRDAWVGCKQEIALKTPARCDDCEGSGAKAGTKRERCGSCGGHGQVSTARGFVMFTQACPQCRGTGSIVRTPCPSCAGHGSVRKARKVVVTFPPGVDSGQRLRVPGQGMPGETGAPAGDLYVDIEVEPDERFERDGSDLAVRLTLPLRDAALGAKRTVVMPDDSEVEFDIAGGVQPGDVLTARGKGFARVNGKGRGDLHAVVQVTIPKKLSKKARQLFEELGEELGEG